MKTLIGIGLLAFALGGCAHSLGYAGSHPGQIICKGKGTISGQGGAMAGAGLGGGEMNSFSVTGDCGDGFSFSQGLPAAPAKP